jgi:ABC-type multidrug transport system ATPase subunit
MIITIKGAGKRYNFEWILQDINLTLAAPGSYAVLGPNGSGKSTFLQLIAGNISPSAGTITFAMEGKGVDEEDIFRFISIAAPYLELPEEFTAREVVLFHQRFKPYLDGIKAEDVLAVARLSTEAKKQVRNFSSGMKQRLKLSLSILSDVPVVLLDEPTTNLDRDGVEWYHDLINKYKQNRLLLVGSNQKREYGFCDQHIDVMTFKSSARNGQRLPA